MNLQLNDADALNQNIFQKNRKTPPHQAMLQKIKMASTDFFQV
jgi:hypothetical protein